MVRANRQAVVAGLSTLRQVTAAADLEPSTYRLLICFRFLNAQSHRPRGVIKLHILLLKRIKFTLPQQEAPTHDPDQERHDLVGGAHTLPHTPQESQGHRGHLLLWASIAFQRALDVSHIASSLGGYRVTLAPRRGQQPAQAVRVQVRDRLPVQRRELVAYP